MTMNDTNGYITLTDAASRSVYSQEYLSLRARQGRLKAVKQGRNWVTTLNWLNEYLNSAEEARRQLREATIANDQVITIKKPSVVDHLFEHHPAATSSMAKKRTAVIAPLTGMSMQSPKIDNQSSGSRSLWTDKQPVSVSNFDELSDNSHDVFGWAELDKSAKSSWQLPQSPVLSKLPLPLSTPSISLPQPVKTAQPASSLATVMATSESQPKVQQSVDPASSAKKDKQSSRFNLDTIFNSLPGLATATVIVGVSFMASFGVGRIGIGAVAEAVAVGGMVLTGNEPTLQWVTGDTEPRVVWGSNTKPDYAKNNQQGLVAGASIDQSGIQQSFGVAQSIAAGLFVVSDSLNPNRYELNGFSSWLADAFNLPS